MKTVKPVLQKVRTKTGKDIFYTYSNWPITMIDGEEYLSVVKSEPNNYKNQVMRYMKKDIMEYVK